MAEEQKHNIMTAESLKKLQERYDYLLNVKRKEIINAIEIARGFGDLSENAEYTEARNDQAKNETCNLCDHHWRCKEGRRDLLLYDTNHVSALYPGITFYPAHKL